MKDEVYVLLSYHYIFLKNVNYILMWMDSERLLCLIIFLIDLYKKYYKNLSLKRSLVKNSVSVKLKRKLIFTCFDIIRHTCIFPR